MESLTAEQKIEKATSILIRDNIFFGSLLMRMELKKDPTCETAWTNGRELGYNPAFISSLSLKQTVFVLAHEVMHPALKHHIRRGKRDPRKWNEAGDYAINDVLLDAGFEGIHGILSNKEFQGMDAETIYARREMGEEEKQQEEKQGENEGDGEKEEGEGNETDDSPSDEEGEEEKEGEKENGKEDGNSGSGSDGEEDGNDSTGDPTKNADEGSSGEGSKQGSSGEGSTDGEDGHSGEMNKQGKCSNYEGNIGEVRDLPEGEDAGKEEVSTDIALSQAMQVANSRGQLPPSLKAWAGEIIDPKLNPVELLKNFIDRTIKSDFSWRRPNKRFISDGLYLPSLDSDKVGKGAFVVDTSGSTWSGELLHIWGKELQHFMDAMQFDMTVIFCDDAVRKVEEYCAGDELKLEFRGGWGTDFRPPFQYLEEQGEAPAFLIYFTDLECYDFPPEPNYPVLWLYYGNHGVTPPFGEVVKI